jgi:hypothetical protein
MKDSLGASITTDITSLHVLNSGAAGTLRLDAFVDPTPDTIPLEPDPELE